MKFRRGSGRPSYKEVGCAGLNKDSAVVIDPKQTFVMSDRRESEQKDGFIVPDQKERFLVSESSWPKLHIPNVAPGKDLQKDSFESLTHWENRGGSPVEQ